MRVVMQLYRNVSNARTVVTGQFEVGHQLDDLGTDERIILMCILWELTEFVSELGPPAFFCEYGHEHSGSIKGKEFLDHLQVLLASPEGLCSTALNKQEVSIKPTYSFHFTTNVSQKEQLKQTVQTCLCVILQLRVTETIRKT
jgi:hypothetical protein